jgi:hypothetical protein
MNAKSTYSIDQGTSYLVQATSQKCPVYVRIFHWYMNTGSTFTCMSHYRQGLDCDWIY